MTRNNLSPRLPPIAAAVSRPSSPDPRAAYPSIIVLLAVCVLALAGSAHARDDGVENSMAVHMVDPTQEITNGCNRANVPWLAVDCATGEELPLEQQPFLAKQDAQLDRMEAALLILGDVERGQLDVAEKTNDALVTLLSDIIAREQRIERMLCALGRTPTDFARGWAMSTVRDESPAAFEACAP